MEPAAPRHTVRNTLLCLLAAAILFSALTVVFLRVKAPWIYDSITNWMVASAQQASAKLRWYFDRQTVRVSANSDVALLRFPVPEKPALPVEELQVVDEPEIVEPPQPAKPSVTDLILAQDVETLTGGNCLLVYYNQLDPEWAGKPFGWDPIGGYGCGPVALSMAVSSLTGQIINPEEMAAWAGSQGYSAPRSGSYISIVEGTASYYKLNCASMSTLDVETLRNTLSSGGLMIALMGPGHFTRRGHFIVLRGVTEDGNILVADPANREKCLTEWDPALILNELSSSRSSGAPLWHLTYDGDA